jgi:hypothetical protein
MAQKYPTPNEIQLFDQYGALILVSEEVLDQWDDAAVAAYQKIADTFTAVAVIENELEAKTKRLHALTATLREHEHRLSMQYKPSHIDLVRSDLVAMNR